MSDTVIKVENLSKLYRLGQFVGYHTLREDMVKALSAPFRRRRHQPPAMNHQPSPTNHQLPATSHELSSMSYHQPSPTSHDPSATSHELSTNFIWALKDVSFEVKQGEAVGIIGRNGAGKTTLLRVLTRITEPTEGYAEIHGRVGSLLEVGTGFHPELTGRENIFLNGAVLGMKKKEIERKFDEIVDFSGVEKFIDTPLKRYSTGMQVRLAFAVAAHLDPEILLVDEVLAVGDAEFQKKCLGKMDDVARGGRTVLFISHNMAAIKRFCSSAIILEKGMILGVYPIADAIERYLSNFQEVTNNKPLHIRTDRRGNGDAKIVDAWLSAGDRMRLKNIPLDVGVLEFHLNIESLYASSAVGIAIGIYNSLNQCIIWLDSRAILKKLPLRKGLNHILCSLSPEFTLVKGHYIVNLAVFGGVEVLDYLSEALSFHVIDGNFYGTGMESGGQPAIYVKQEWKIQ